MVMEKMVGTDPEALVHRVEVVEVAEAELLGPTDQERTLERVVITI
jgi:hypothetical protein